MVGDPAVIKVVLSAKVILTNIPFTDLIYRLLTIYALFVSLLACVPAVSFVNSTKYTFPAGSQINQSPDA